MGEGEGERRAEKRGVDGRKWGGKVGNIRVNQCHGLGLYIQF